MSLKSWFFAGVGAVVIALAAQAADTAPRFSPLPVEKMTAEQKAALQKEIERGWNPTGLAALTARNPQSYEARNALHRTLFGDPNDKEALPMSHSMLAVLIVLKHWDIGGPTYENTAKAALKTGLSQAAVDGVSKGERPAGAAPVELAVYDFANELVRDFTVSDATFKKSREHLTERNILDLSGIVGFYTEGAMFMQAAGQAVNPR